MAYLEALNGSQTGRHYELDKSIAILGRHPDCEIILDSGAVSRQHAKIRRDGDRFVIEDLKSRNGTFVNGHLLAEPQKLTDGEMIRICDLEFAFRGDCEVAPLSEIGNEMLDSDSVGMLMISDANDLGGRMVTERVNCDGGTVFDSTAADRKLSMMIDINKQLSRVIGLEEVLPTLLDRLFQLFPQADRGFILLRDRRGQLVPRWMKARRPDLEDTLRMSRTIVRHVIEEKQAIISLDAASDDRFNQAQSVFDLRLRSVIIAPLLDADGEPLGALYLDTVRQRTKFDRKDLELLVAVAASAGLAIVNAQLHEQIVQQAMLDADLKLARQVQLAFLPRAAPPPDVFEYYQHYSAAHWVGGDYFDYIPLGGDRTAVVVADVVGHGIAAAMFMAKLSAEARYAFAATPDPAAAMTRLNARICELQLERFITMSVLITDRRDENIFIVNAGHSPPMVRRVDGTIEEPGHEESGLPLGIYEDIEYTATQIRLGCGDMIMQYTDGIFEAPNPAGEQFSVRRIREMLAECEDGCEKIGGDLIDAVLQHIGGGEQEDDMCLVVLRRIEAAGERTFSQSPLEVE